MQTHSIFQMIYPEWIKEWTGPRCPSFNTLYAVTSLMESFMPSRPDYTFEGAMTTPINPEELKHFCSNLIRTGGGSGPFEVSLRLARYLHWDDISDSIQNAVLDGRCDNTETVAAALTLETFGLISEEVIASVRTLLVDLDPGDRVVEGVLGLLVRNGTDEDRVSVHSRLKHQIDEAIDEESGSWIPGEAAAVLSELHGRGEDVSETILTILESSVIPEYKGFQDAILRLSAKLELSLPFGALASNAHQTTITNVLEEILHNPDKFTSSRGTLEGALDDIYTLDSDLGAVAITALSRIGGDRALIASYTDADEWRRRIGGYWGLFPAATTSELNGYLAKEEDADAHAVLVYLLALKDGHGNVALAELDEKRIYSCVSMVLEHDYSIPVDRHSASGIIREIRRDFGRNLSGQEIEGVLTSGSIGESSGMTKVWAGEWAGTDKGYTHIALVNAGDLSVRNTVEAFLTSVTGEWDLQNAMMTSSVLGGAMTEVGRMIQRLFSFGSGTRWIDESRYPLIEHLIYSDDSDISGIALQAVERSVIGNRPRLFRMLWESGNDDDKKLCYELLPLMDGASPFIDTLRRIVDNDISDSDSLEPLSGEIASSNIWDVLLPTVVQNEGLPLVVKRKVLRHLLQQGQRGSLHTYSEMMGEPKETIVTQFSRSSDWQLRRLAVWEMADNPRKEYVSALVMLFSGETDDDVLQAASDAFKRAQKAYPDEAKNIIVLENTDSDGNRNYNEDWDIVFDRFTEYEYDEDTLSTYLGRRLILEPVSTVPATPGVLEEDEWNGLATHLTIQYQDESSGHILVEVTKEPSAEIFGLLLNNRPVGLFVGRWV